MRGSCFLLALAVAGCHPDEKAFFGKTYACDPSAARCGTSMTGQTLTCFGGKQLGGGRDFCVEECSQGQPEEASAICVDGRAKLRTCRPSEGTADDPDGCGPDLACYRTDLISDTGVCLAMPVCSVDADCKDPVLSTCASSVLKAAVPGAPFQTSNLQCVVGGCKARQTSCPAGETCLPTVVPATSPVPDICVPSCDSRMNCPPNYVCWKRVSGPASPNVCLPTLAGVRCTASIDCMVGECLDTGEGFSLCSVPCESDHDCARYSDSSHKMYCVPTQDARRHCVPISTFAGSLCLMDVHCPAGQKCFFTSPYSTKPTQLGECRLPCGPEDRCPTRGGLTHTCFVRDDSKSCYPAILGLTCRRNEDCSSGNTCETLPLEERLRPEPPGTDPGTVRVCARPCTGDVDCVDPWMNQEGYCEGGWCRIGAGQGGRCSRDQQCGRGHCDRPGNEPWGTCDYPPL